MGVKDKTNIEDEVKTDYEDPKDIDLETTNNNTLLPSTYSAKNPVSEKIVSIIKFDIIQSSPPIDPAITTIDQEFLISIANWECGSTRDIYTRMLEIDHICRVINKQFNLNARP